MRSDMLGSVFWVEHTYRISWNTLSNVGYVGSRCLSSKIESKSWRSGGGLSGEIGLRRSGLLRFRPRPSFETAHFAGSKSCPPRSSPATAEPARSLGNHLIRVETRKVATYAQIRSLDPTFPLDSSTETLLHILNNQIRHIQRPVDTDDQGHFDVAGIGRSGDEVDVAGFQLPGLHCRIIVIHGLA